MRTDINSLSLKDFLNDPKSLINHEHNKNYINKHGLYNNIKNSELNNKRKSYYMDKLLKTSFLIWDDFLVTYNNLKNEFYSEYEYYKSLNNKNK